MTNSDGVYLIMPSGWKKSFQERREQVIKALDLCQSLPYVTYVLEHVDQELEDALAQAQKSEDVLG